MDKFKAIFIMLILVLFVGLFLLGSGITGMVSNSEDPFLKPVCSIDAECGKDVCCLFYESDSGVCDALEMCPSIYELTRLEKEEVNNSIEVPYDWGNRDNILKIVIGFSLIIIIVVSLYFYKSRN